MKELHYTAQTYLHDRDRRPADFRELQTDISPRVDDASEHIRTSESTRPTLADPTRGKETPRAAAGVIAARLLAVLVVIMVVTSIVGFTVFDSQGGNSATAITSLVIGAAAAVIGMSLGFLKAYQSELER